jgi:FkbM family methyltransferase
MIEYFPQSRIIAFEPDPRNTEWFGNFLSQQITKGSVELIKKAIWSSSGEIPFTFQASNTADNKFDPGSDIKVPSISIDDYALRTGIKIDLMKIDVQGFEWEVIKGSLVTLQQQRPSLILELDLEALNARGGSENELFDLLGELNYSVINPIDGKTLNRSKVRDLIAVERCIDLLLVPLSDKVTEKS